MLSVRRWDQDSGLNVGQMLQIWGILQVNRRSSLGLGSLLTDGAEQSMLNRLCHKVLVETVNTSLLHRESGRSLVRAPGLHHRRFYQLVHLTLSIQSVGPAC